MTMPFQVAVVNEVSGSAREVVDVGNRDILDRDDEGRPRGHVLHEAIGHKAAIHERSGFLQ